MQAHDTTQPIKIGSRIGSGTETYEVVAEIGRGGMGVVYKAVQPSLERTVAIKMLSAQRADPIALQRLIREGRLSATLDHPNIVRVYSFNADVEGHPFVVMEFIEGKTLSELLKERTKLDLDAFFDIFDQVLSALHYAHARGLIHRDIKPSNIMVTTGGTIKLMDFGVAKLTSPTGETTSQVLTQAGAVVGSPWYMSPEQCAGSEVDGRSDIYSVGCTMYEALTGSPPFGGDNPLEVMFHHVHSQADTLSKSADPKVAEVVAKSISKEKEERYETAEEFQSVLRSCRTGSYIPTRKRQLRLPKAKLPYLIIACLAAGLVFGMTGLRAPQSNETEFKSPTLERHRGEPQSPTQAADIVTDFFAYEFFPHSDKLSDAAKNSYHKQCEELLLRALNSKGRPADPFGEFRCYKQLAGIAGRTDLKKAVEYYLLALRASENLKDLDRFDDILETHIAALDNMRQSRNVENFENVADRATAIVAPYAEESPRAKIKLAKINEQRMFFLWQYKVDLAAAESLLHNVIAQYREANAGRSSKDEVEIRKYLPILQGQRKTNPVKAQGAG